MKKTKIHLGAKLALRKETISDLSAAQRGLVQGGGFTQDDSGCNCPAPKPTLMIACPPDTVMLSCRRALEGGCIVASYPLPYQQCAPKAVGN